jgi:hypothetical protein
MLPLMACVWAKAGNDRVISATAENEMRPDFIGSLSRKWLQMRRKHKKRAFCEYQYSQINTQQYRDISDELPSLSYYGFRKRRAGLAAFARAMCLRMAA